jgi:hypothetical protein
LKVVLGTGQEPQCTRACKPMLDAHSFSKQALNEAVQEAMANNTVAAQEASKTKVAKTEDAKTEPIKMEPSTVQREDAFQCVRDLAPILTLLPAGEGGKRYPFFCNICHLLTCSQTALHHYVTVRSSM